MTTLTTYLCRGCEGRGIVNGYTLNTPGSSECEVCDGHAEVTRIEDACLCRHCDQPITGNLDGASPQFCSAQCRSAQYQIDTERA